MTRALVALLLVAACSSSNTTVTSAGALQLTLAGASGNDGALVVTVSGGPVSSVSVPSGFQVVSNSDGAGTHIMIVGNLAAGVVATLNVPDATAAGAYVATVTQVADRSSFALLDPVRYQITISK